MSATHFVAWPLLSANYNALDPLSDQEKAKLPRYSRYYWIIDTTFRMHPNSLRAHRLFLNWALKNRDAGRMAASRACLELAGLYHPLPNAFVPGYLPLRL